MKKLNIEIKQENNDPADHEQQETVVVQVDTKHSHVATNVKSQPDTTANEQPLSEKDLKLQELHENRFNKKGARIAFHLVNFGGLHQIFNNVASVIITYYLATTKGADWMKESLAKSEAGKVISFALSLPGKAVNGAFKLGGVELNKGLNALPEAEKTAEIAYRAAKSRRSAIETLFMCIAGFVALAPVWYLENHREGFLNKVDNWLHPNRTPEEKEAAALKPGDEPKETWWNLIRARLVALAVVFSIDQVRDNVDSILKHNHISQGKPGMYKNIDSVAGWGFGNKIYDRMPAKLRSWTARFLSANKVKLSGIQHENLEDILQITNAPPEILDAGKQILGHHEKIRRHIGNPEEQLKIMAEIEHIEAGLKKDSKLFAHVERAVFAEQSRLFITKEFFLTTILSVVIYGATKWKPAHNLLSKVGFTKKSPKETCHDEQGLNEVSVVPAVAVIEDSIAGTHEPQHSSKKHCTPEKNKFSNRVSAKKSSRSEASASFADKIMQSQEQQGLQLGT